MGGFKESNGWLKNAGGLIAYLAGTKAKREQRERWQREWRRQRSCARSNAPGSSERSTGRSFLNT